MNGVAWSTIFIFGIFIFYYYALHSTIQAKEESRLARISSLGLYLLVPLLYFLTLGLGILISLYGLLVSHIPPETIQAFLNIPKNEINQLAKSIHIIAMAFWLPSLIAILFYVPFVRRPLARLLPIDAQNRVHTVSLAIAMLIFIQLFVVYGIGLNTLAAEFNQTPSAGTLLDLWTQDILFALLAMVGVGWMTQRNTSQTLKRLGITRITWKQALLAVLVAWAFILVGNGLESLFQTTFSSPQQQDVEKLTEQILGPLFTSGLGIFTLGAAAAIGEEPIFRGALVPRFGIIFSALLFAFVHANYGFSSSTLIVFLLGLALGWLRMRYNTTFTMIVHAVYNMTLGLLVYTQVS
jgi:membrane protease YdiL (CAAX protease family)